MDHERMSGAVDQEAFERAIRENLSSEGVATIIAFLAAGDDGQGPDRRGNAGLGELEWFANTLIELLGVAEYNRLLDELGL
ncbi:MAG: hypothetical protein GXX96_17350 [Planctomycetaceae bacterium]|jgi:hypothetical protein|nr:hypothetical protein [Planctomycetaceae bacterium]